MAMAHHVHVAVVRRDDKDGTAGQASIINSCDVLADHGVELGNHRKVDLCRDMQPRARTISTAVPTGRRLKRQS